MREIRQIMQVTKWSFLDWLMDIRQILVLVVLCCISNYSVTPLVHMAEDKQKPMNIVEPFLANINCIYIILIVLICWLVLISDYPKMEGNNGYILIRINRLIWLAGKVFSFLLAAVTYILEIIMVFTLRAVHVCYVSNGWSYLMKDFILSYNGEEAESYRIICFMRENVFNHYLPFQAFWKTVFLMLGLLCMLALIMMVSSLGKSKMVGLIVNLLLIVGGFSVMQAGSMYRCYLPVANVMLGEQATELIRLIPKNFSAIYFAVCCSVLLVCSVILVRNGQIQKDGER